MQQVVDQNVRLDDDFEKLLSAFITPILNYRRKSRKNKETVDHPNDHDCNNTANVRIPTSKGDVEYNPSTIRRYWLKFLTTQIHTSIPYMTNAENYKHIKSCFIIGNKDPHHVYEFAMGFLAFLISKHLFLEMATYVSSESSGSKLYPFVVTLDTIHVINDENIIKDQKNCGSPSCNSMSSTPSSSEDEDNTTPPTTTEKENIKKLFRLPKLISIKNQNRIPERGLFNNEMYHIIPIPTTEGNNFFF